MSSCASNVRRVRAEGEHRADDERENHRESDSCPQPRQHVATAEPGDIGDEDADDECCFQAFAQADEEGGEHGRSRRGSGEEVR